jgi:hypothetical protein
MKLLLSINAMQCPTIPTGMGGKAKEKIFG